VGRAGDHQTWVNISRAERSWSHKTGAEGHETGMEREWSGVGDHKTQMRREIITPVIESSSQSERLSNLQVIN
jgi:hypothetical protein